MGRPVWRLLSHEARDGAWNMAVDEVLLSGKAEGSSPPTLRLYAWEKPTVSLGRFQALDGIDIEACEEFGVAIVRRPTGGRGVLHDDEVTYAVVAGTADGVPRGTAASYRHVSGGLVAAYRILGVAADITRRPRGGDAAACYLHSTTADLSLGVAKLSGSAQRWQGDTCVQHGSFVRTRDVLLEGRVFRLDPDGISKLARTTATLADALGEAPALDVVRDAVVAGFEYSLGVRLEPGCLSDDEEEKALTLRSHKVEVKG
ncbi:MAG: lipoate--protein ligase family protein [Coriobacteriia bacterium]